MRTSLILGIVFLIIGGAFIYIDTKDFTEYIQINTLIGLLIGAGIGLLIGAFSGYIGKKRQISKKEEKTKKKEAELAAKTAKKETEIKEKEEKVKSEINTTSDNNDNNSSIE